MFEQSIREQSIRELKSMPFDKVFDVDGNEELCQATGYEVAFGDPSDPRNWWNEYEDSLGDLHYGR